MHKNNALNFLISVLLYIVNISILHLASCFGSHLHKKKKKDSRIVPNWRKFWVLTLLLYLWSPSFRRMKTSAKPPKGMFLPSRSVMVTCPFHSWFLRKESESRALRVKLDWKVSGRHKTVIHSKPGVYAHLDSDMKSSEVREVPAVPHSKQGTEGTKKLRVLCLLHATACSVKGPYSASKQHQHI